MALLSKRKATMAVGFFLSFLFVGSVFASTRVMRVLAENYDLDAACIANNLDFQSLTDDWYAEMRANVEFDSEVIDAFDRRWFGDASLLGAGALDIYALEKNNVVLVGGLGAKVIPDDYFTMMLNLSYNSNCVVRPNADMYLGDETGELAILQVIASHSMTADDNVHSTTWNSTFKNIHQIHGFHGDAAFNTGLAANWEQFATDAFSESVSLAWVDNLGIDSASPDGDNCPVAYTGRSSLMAVLNALANENYSNYSVFADPDSPAVWGQRAVSGCDPREAEPW